VAHFRFLGRQRGNGWAAQWAAFGIHGLLGCCLSEEVLTEDGGEQQDREQAMSAANAKSPYASSADVVG